MTESLHQAGQSRVDDLVKLLDLEQIEENIFRGVSPNVTLQRVFGGQVAGQALTAAVRTVEVGKHVHSLHSYFIRPGDPTVPIVYMVDRVRDGRSFSTRRVVAVQHGKAIFSLSASFQFDQDGVSHQSPMPDAPPPEQSFSLEEIYAGLDFMPTLRRVPWPFEVRYVDPPSWALRAPSMVQPRRVWMRASGRLPDDPLVHVCALTYASDLTLLDVVLSLHDIKDRTAVQSASLDHAVWFHRRFRADEWFLYAEESPSASGARGLAMGRIFTHDGRHVVTVLQEGMIRVND